jgi:hypothetical protein
VSDFGAWNFTSDLLSDSPKMKMSDVFLSDCNLKASGGIFGASRLIFLGFGVGFGVSSCIFDFFVGIFGVEGLIGAGMAERPNGVSGLDDGVDGLD